jgi:hypothetical protein
VFRAKKKKKMESGNVFPPDPDLSRPPEPPYFGGLHQSQSQPMSQAMDSVYRADTQSVLPPVSTATPSDGEKVRHDLRAETAALREKFQSEVRAQAKKQNDADRLNQRIEERRRHYQELSRKGPKASNESTEVRLTPRPANGEDDVVETFTTPGLLLRQQETLLTENRFTPTRVLQAEHDREFKEGFRRWYEAQRDKEERRERIAAAENDPLRTNNYAQASGAPSTADQAAKPPDSVGNQLTDPHEIDRLNKPRITQQLVDSRDRDLTRYSDPNDYVFNLSRRFSNVKRVKMISSEIPNTAILIRDDPREALVTRNKLLLKCGEVLNDSNKHFYWINEEDAIEPGIYDCVIYDGCITPGNYVSVACQCNETTLADEIERVTNGINRFIDGTPHEFLVDIDPQTNEVSILSIQSQQLPLNPISAVAGTNIVTVEQLSHPFEVDDFVTLSGVVGTVGGIPASVLNGEHKIIEVPDEDHYVFRVTTVASQTVSGGGANVLAGRDKPFMLLASNLDTPFSQVIGFPQQDSAEQIAINIDFIDCGPPNLAVDSGDGTDPGSAPARITAFDHGLNVGDEILILDTDTIPPLNGLQQVTKVIDQDMFEVGELVKVVNNQVVTTQLVLGSVCRSLDEQVSFISNLTARIDGYICTACPHNLDSDPPNNTVWLGNIVGGLTKTLQDVNGLQTVGEYISENKFNITDGIIFEGLENGNAFMVKTSSTALQEITEIIPANNGRITPAASVPIFTGSLVPEYVIFTSTETVPDINGDITVDIDAVGNCSTFVFKGSTSDFWQSFVPETSSRLASIYVRVGEGLIGDSAVLRVYEGAGPPAGMPLGVSHAASMERDVCTGALFCMVETFPVTAGTTYTWSIELLTSLSQQVVACVDDDLYPNGRNDISATSDYSFRVYRTPGVQAVDYYSQMSGKFDLDTMIMEVLFQNPNQSYVRSSDPDIRCVEDAIIASNGVWTFMTPHGCAVGDLILVSLTTLPNQTTDPFISPNVIGLLTVAKVLSDRTFSTSLTITSSSYDGSAINGALRIVKTTDVDVTDILNIYPKSSGYLCKPANRCDDPSRNVCILCSGDMIVIRGGEGQMPMDYETDLAQCDSDGMMVGNVFGCYTVDHVFNSSPNCGVIFDLALDGGRIKLPDGVTDPNLANLGECVRLYADGAVTGQNGQFAQARVRFISEVCPEGEDSPAISVVTFQKEPEFLWNSNDILQGINPIRRSTTFMMMNYYYYEIIWGGGHSFNYVTRRHVFVSRYPEVAGVNGWSINNYYYMNNVSISCNAAAAGSARIRNGSRIHLGTGQVIPMANLTPNPFNGDAIVVNWRVADIATQAYWLVNTPAGITDYYIWYQIQVTTTGAIGTNITNCAPFSSAAVPLLTTVYGADPFVFGRIGIGPIILDLVPSGFGPFASNFNFPFLSKTDIATLTKTAIDLAAPPFSVSQAGPSLTVTNGFPGLPCAAAMCAMADPHIVDGPGGGTTGESSFISIGEINPGSSTMEQDTVYTTALCVQTFLPHLLGSGCAIYMVAPRLDLMPPIEAPGCDLEPNRFSLITNPDLHNRIGIAIPDPNDDTIFKIYGIPFVSGTGNVTTACQLSIPEGVEPLGAENQFWYHKICGSEFEGIQDFYPKSYDGMLESTAHGLTPNANNFIYVSQTSVSPSLVGCTDACVIDENFFTLNTLGQLSNGTIDPELWQLPFSGVADVGSIVGNVINILTTLEVELLSSDTTQQVAQRLVDALNDPMLEPFNTLGTGTSPLTASVITTGTGDQLVTVVNDAGIGFRRPIADSSDVNTGFVFTTTQQGSAAQTEITDITISQTGADFLISPETGLHVVEGEKARYFLLNAQNENFGITFFYTYYVWFPVHNVLCTGNVGHGFAGNFVNTGDDCVALTVADVTAQNDGIIIAENSFQGGECVYFLNDTNLNLGGANDLRNAFFTVSTDNLTPFQFSLNVPIETVGSVIGAAITPCETITYNVAGQYSFVATTGCYEVIISGAGGGNGYDYTPSGTGSPGIGGRGGLISGNIEVTVGETIHVFIGGAGLTGSYLTESQLTQGGFNGGGTARGYTDVIGRPHGQGSGGGATDIRVGGTDLADRIAVAGGGGGGTAYMPPATGITDPSNPMARLQRGFDGGDGGGPNGSDGDGDPVGATGKGGTQISGGAPGTAGGFFNTASSGTFGIGGGASLLGAVAYVGGGGGWYGGGGGVAASFLDTDDEEGGGGGGSSRAPSNCSCTTGGGSAAATDGFAILRPLNQAIFKDQGTYTFTVPINATRMKMTVAGARGGKGGDFVPGPDLGADGGIGGLVAAEFVVGVASQIQSGTTLIVNVGGDGEDGQDSTDPEDFAMGGFNGGGNGQVKGAVAAAGGGGGGGGSSDVRIGSGTLDERIIVAGGGGGGGGGGAFGPIGAGDGCGAIGQDAEGRYASGGSQTMGGVGEGPGGFGFGGTAGGVLSSPQAAGGGGGWYGGGAGVKVNQQPPAITPYGGFGGGGGSGFVTPDSETYIDGTLVQVTGGAPGGNACIVIEWSTRSEVSLPMGHFVEVPCPDVCDPCGGEFNAIDLIEVKHNGVFCSANVTNFPIGNLAQPETSTCIFLTDGKYGDTDVPKLWDVLANAVPYQTPPPVFSETKFETTLTINPDDLDIGGFPLGGNKVDPVSTNDARYPGILGLGWILATDCKKNPIIKIQRDSNGTLSPVKPGLQVGDTIYIDSMHPTVPDLTGTHIVSYVDVGNGSFPQFFELADVEIEDVGPSPIPDGNIICFRSPPVEGNTSPCVPINEIVANVCPTDLRVTNHGYQVGSTINLYIVDSLTDPSINSTENGQIVRDIITGVKVVDTDILRLPEFDSFGNSLCYLDVLNQTNLLVEPRGRFSKQILSTNCGVAYFEPDPANNRTVIFTPSRPNLHTTISYPILFSTANPTGTSTVFLDMPAGVDLRDVWVAGNVVTITGHQLGDPYLEGPYKIFNVQIDRFDILSGANIFSTGGTAGVATGPAPSTVPGHGLQTGDLVKFGGGAMTKPVVTNDDQMFEITVIDEYRFSIDFLVEDVLCHGEWCNNYINAEIKDHGLIDGDIFFLYSSQCVGGLVPYQINTVHGDKRKNIPTRDEIETRKVVRVVDGNNIQFLSNYNSFPTTRAIGGGYEVCISAKNHTIQEQETLGLRNYGFASVQTNKECTGDLRRFLNFSNDAYILMTSGRLTTDDINPVINTGLVDKIFAKIQLSGDPGDVMYDTYVGGERIFYEPIARMDHIDIQFRRYDNKLFDFRGREHSFTLEIEEYQDRLRTANKSSRRGLNDPGAIGSVGLVESAISRENPVQNLAGALQPSQFVEATSLTQRAL